jgi:hypothetical protein
MKDGDLYTTLPDIINTGREIAPALFTKNAI